MNINLMRKSDRRSGTSRQHRFAETLHSVAKGGVQQGANAINYQIFNLGTEITGLISAHRRRLFANGRAPTKSAAVK
jgi:hypothetical protein